jgi:tRNA-2-methylthio-N6-dimethylallyladenosine synthase
MKKVKIETFGCQMNKADSEKMYGLLSTIGYTETEFTEDADLIVINTCSIRENAVNRLTGHLGQFKTIKKYNPDLIIAVGGCVPQHEKENLRKKASWIDIIFGSQNFNKIHEMVRKFEENRKPIVSIVKQGDVYEDDMPVIRSNKYTAWVTVMNGCSRYCTFCIVPYVRGNESSRNPESIIREVEIAISEGYKEVTLLGQIIDLYGRDLRPRITFDELLRKVSAVNGLERLRFLTSHPKYMSKNIIDTVAETPNICNFFHLPLQSGNDEILQKMNRKHSIKEYEELINYIRFKIPDATITTDLIVGFPGETEDQFMDTVNNYIKFGFDNSMTAAYSPRPGTPAAEMDNQIPEEEKNRRLNYLNNIVKRIAKEKNEREIGKIRKILVEGFNKDKNGKFYGRTDGNKLVHFDGDESLLGKIIEVRITDATISSLRGEVMKLSKV